MCPARPLVVSAAPRAAALVACLLAACSHAAGPRQDATAGPAEGPSAAASASAAAPAPLRLARTVLRPLGGSHVAGTLTFTELAEGGVRVEGRITGLPAAGLHGFHVHAVGDCSAADGSSAGGHFNPGQQAHGDPAGAAAAHLGDLGNVQADAGGTADVMVVRREATLDAGGQSFVGHSVILHRLPDDLRSQPAGASGERIACGVIQAA